MIMFERAIFRVIAIAALLFGFLSVVTSCEDKMQSEACIISGRQIVVNHIYTLLEGM